MVVLAIIAGLMYLGSSAIKWVTRSTLVENAQHLGALLRRSSQLAVEQGALHRLVIDLDAQTYRVEACEGGSAAISREPEPEVDRSADKRQAAIEEARRRLAGLPAGALPAGVDTSAEDMALALAGQLGARRVCTLTDGVTGDLDSKPLTGKIDTDRDVRIKAVWVQHLEDPVTSGLVAIHFFPLGSAEKAVIEVADDRGAFHVLVHGLTGRVEVRSEPLRDPEGFFLRDAEGNRVAPP